METLEFKTEFQSGEGFVNITWVVVNPKVSWYVRHSRDFIDMEQTVEQMIASYEQTATQELFSAIEQKFPGQYTL